MFKNIGLERGNTRRTNDIIIVWDMIFSILFIKTVLNYVQKKV